MHRATFRLTSSCLITLRIVSPVAASFSQNTAPPRAMVTEEMSKASDKTVMDRVKHDGPDVDLFKHQQEPCGVKVLSRDTKEAILDEAERQGIKVYRLPPEAFHGYQEKLRDFIRQNQLEPNWDSPNKRDLHRYMSAVMAFTTSWLPVDLIFDLHRFFWDREAPSNIIIQGLPVDPDLPPTPLTGEVLPPVAASAVVLTLATLLGEPHSNMLAAVNPKGRLVYDLVTRPARDDKERATIKDFIEELSMHQDMPFVKDSVNCLLLYGLRKCPTRDVYTMICDNRHLMANMAPEDIQSLRRDQMEYILPPESGRPKCEWRCITDDDQIKLTDVKLEHGAVIKGKDEAMTRAFFRCAALAHELAYHVLLGPGDALVLNNKRCVHGRTQDDVKWDGTDRWLLKTMVGRPGSLYDKAGRGLKWPEVAV